MGVVWQKRAWSPKIFSARSARALFQKNPSSLIPGSASDVLELYKQLGALSLPTLVPQGYSALFVCILSGESIAMMKAWIHREKASGLISIKIVWEHDNLIYDFLTLS